MIETAFQVSEKMGISASYTGLVDGNVLLVGESVAFGVYYDVK